jgi:hypothetical protein
MPCDADCKRYIDSLRSVLMVRLLLLFLLLRCRLLKMLMLLLLLLLLPSPLLRLDKRIAALCLLRVLLGHGVMEAVLLQLLLLGQWPMVLVVA